MLLYRVQQESKVSRSDVTCLDRLVRMRAGTFLRCKMIAPLFVLLVLLAGYSHVSLAQTESDLTKTLITEEQVLVRRTL